MKLAIIGGSGLEKLDIFRAEDTLFPETKYGHPGAPLVCGHIGEMAVIFLSRHGREHTIPPSQVPNRANIMALKNAGCTHIIATTACGSLRQEIGRGDFVIPDQFIDFTRHRPITFHEQFEPHEAVHTPMATPFNEELRSVIIHSSRELGLCFHDKGTVVTIEGPRFSTRAESNMFRLWGADVINMSTAPEVTLANEAGIPYAAIALSTDYDCWKTDEAPVSWEEVFAVFNKNVDNVTQLLIKVIERLGNRG